MPTFIHTDGYPSSTEAELLEFANKLRAAGAAEPLEALLPGVPEDPNECLIANALNFGCRVAGSSSDRYPGENAWKMLLPCNLDPARVQALAAAIDCPVDPPPRLTVHSEWRIELPRLIGNAAAAFDQAKRGWVVKYRKQG